MKHLISKIVGNDTIYIQAYNHTGKKGKYRIEFTGDENEALDFGTERFCKDMCQIFTDADGKNYNHERKSEGPLSTKGAGFCSPANGIAVILIIMLASCSNVRTWTVANIKADTVQFAGSSKRFIVHRADTLKAGQKIQVEINTKHLPSIKVVKS